MEFRIFTSPQVDTYLEKHQLLAEFRKAATKLKLGVMTGLDLKKREPKSLNIWSFRITIKYRAWCKRKGNRLTVYKIDDHQ